MSTKLARPALVHPRSATSYFRSGVLAMLKLSEPLA